MQQDVLKRVEKEYLIDRDVDFKPGDTVAVSKVIREGEKTRIQVFQGIVIKRRGTGTGATFTVRKVSGSVYVEKVFPLNSPLVADIKVIKKGRVRRSKLYYLRGRTGKSARVKEKKK